MSEATLQAEKREFKTELKQLLHIITHSLYSNKEIFLRELISNASDAINKIKFNSIDHDQLLEDNKDWKIKITANKEAGLLTISDNGIGMSREDVIENLGTIAKSGTRLFLENLKSANTSQRPDLIGQFGVGFYSAFMVADKVTVVTRTAGDPKTAVRWESDGQGEFTIEPTEKATRGTDVILHMKKDELDFLEVWKLRSLVKKFSDFLEYPVVMDIEEEEGEGEEKKKTIVETALNSQKAIWLRNKSEVSKEEYDEFYKSISNDFDPPAGVIHYTAEGANEFRVLLFIPAHKPFEFQFGEVKSGPKLYIQRVLIMDHCEELLPQYLRFVKGVVDSSDLPLNISRELLQHNPLLEKIRTNIVRSILKELEGMKNTKFDEYLKFYKELGGILKEGVGRDWNFRKQLADLLLFESINNEAGKYISLAQYVEKMPAEQKEIYYLAGESREQLEHSPYLEAFRAQGFDVLLMTEPIDEFVIPGLTEYQEKKLKAVDRSDATPDKKAEGQEKFQALFDFLKTRITEVSEVRLSTRLKESAAVLVAREGAMNANMERIMQRMGQGVPELASKRTLELNGDHPVVQSLLDVYSRNAEDPRVLDFARLLYDQAVIAEGSKVKDPTAFAKRINDLLLKNLN